MICARCGDPVPESPCPLCGDSPLLDGRYRLERVLGHGAVGTTYLATALEDGTTVAIKELPLRHLDGAKARELVHREARVLRELDHPCIPAYREDLVVGTGRLRTLYLVEEHIEGETLADERARRRYTEDEVLQIAEELLGILAYLHGLSPPVVHRDVKPGNVMRRPDGTLCLIDFGSVRDVIKGELGGSTVAGTFGYMAPEQFQGDATPATDLYGVGALATSLLTRREPHTMADYAGRIRWEAHASVRAATARFVNGLVEPDPARRFAHVRDALAAVRDARLELTSAPRPAVIPGPAAELPARPAPALAPPPVAPPSRPHVPEDVPTVWGHRPPRRVALDLALERVRQTRSALRPMVPHSPFQAQPAPMSALERGAIELIVERVAMHPEIAGPAVLYGVAMIITVLTMTASALVILLL